MADKLNKNQTLYYFVNGDPTHTDIAKATDLAERVEFVNLADVDLNAGPSPQIIYVAGEVPEMYLGATVLDRRTVPTVSDKPKQRNERPE